LFTRHGCVAAEPGKSNVENKVELPEMREIDSQSEGPQSEGRLTEALRRLAASSRQGAPAEVGTGLATAFRRHHVRRRMVRRVRMAALAACLLLAAWLWSMRTPSRQPSNTATSSAPSPANPSSAPKKVSEQHAAPAVTTTQVRPAVKQASLKAPVQSAANRQFVALPAYDPRIPLEEMRVVRVELPASALWQMGAPLNSDTANRRMLADFVVGQDGTPYAMRLLQ